MLEKFNLIMEQEEVRKKMQEGYDKVKPIVGQVDADIPIIYNGVSDNLNSLALSQDNNGNYYVNIR